MAQMIDGVVINEILAAPGGFDTDMAQVFFAFVEFHAGLAIAFDPALDQHVQFGPNGLGTGVATPQAARERGEKEQRQCRND